LFEVFIVTALAVAIHEHSSSNVTLGGPLCHADVVLVSDFIEDSEMDSLIYSRLGWQKDIASVSQAY
jgi:hypothetical protein